jgi:hypothetical protein
VSEDRTLQLCLKMDSESEQRRTKCQAATDDSGCVALRIEEAVLGVRIELCSVSPRHAAAIQSIARFDQTSSSPRITTYHNVSSLHPTSSRYKSLILFVHSFTMSLILDDPRDTCSSHGDDASGDTEPPVPTLEEDAHAGVKKVEAAQRVYGRYSRWCLFIGYVQLTTAQAPSPNSLLLIALD